MHVFAFNELESELSRLKSTHFYSMFLLNIFIETSKLHATPDRNSNGWPKRLIYMLRNNFCQILYREQTNQNKRVFCKWNLQIKENAVIKPHTLLVLPHA